MRRSLILPLGALAAIVPAPATAQTLTDVIGSLVSLDARVTLQAGAITVIDGRVTTNTQAISQLEVDRASLLDRLAVIDSAAAAVATNLQAQQQAVGALTGQFAASVNAADALALDVRAQGSAIGALDGRLGTTVNAVAQQGVRIDLVNQIALAAQDSVVTLRGDLDAGRAGMTRQSDPNGAITIGAQSGGAVVSFTGTAGDRRLSGVADGIAANDAATVGQLTASSSATLSAANGYTDRSAAATLTAANDYTDRAMSQTLERAAITSRQMIAANNVELRRDMSALAAGSNALSALPQAFIPGRGMMGAAIGGSRGQTAFAMGLSKAFTGENAPVVRAGAAVDTRHGDFSYNASVGFHF
ncbi:YadA C-terminal domain-containing protein [uncultured Sphingomonas sp.]|uniref:YadA C-terminal domain-containing protein n=1 Tax=uncultured Sphingomonas sp. TaxID=158754 RepID=UPI0026077D21|nr:YadA-like family protein [uncultured Sphingomonas sp.]